jgi:VanZ family protein
MKLNVRKLWFMIGIAIVVLLWALSLMPAPPHVGIHNADKFGHFIMYGGTMWWWGQLWSRFRTHAILAILLTLMGVAAEFAQGATSWRSFDINDMIANGIGVVIGWVILYTPLGSLLTRLTSPMHK